MVKMIVKQRFESNETALEFCNYLRRAKKENVRKYIVVEWENK